MPNYQVYLVGGAVRDELLGLPIVDRDWLVTGATPASLLTDGYTQVGKQFPVFLHPRTKEEYALARTEKKHGQGYTGFICDFAPHIRLEEDLLRRDLTINAMAKSADGQLHDPYNGQQDLQNRVLRHVSDAFVEDPLRVVRVARFAARFAPFGFQIAPETLALMGKISLSGELSTIPPERIWRELEKALQSDQPQVFFDVLQSCGALEKLFTGFVWPLPKAVESTTPFVSSLSTSAQKWAYLSHATKPDALGPLNQHLRAPNQYNNLSLQVSEFFHQQTLPQSPQVWEAWLVRVGALKKPQPYALLVQILAQLTQTDVTHWLDLRQQTAGINASKLMKLGFHGAELGEAIKLARQHSLNNASNPLVLSTATD